MKGYVVGFVPTLRIKWVNKNRDIQKSCWNVNKTQLIIGQPLLFWRGETSAHRYMHTLHYTHSFIHTNTHWHIQPPTTTTEYSERSQLKSWDWLVTYFFILSACIQRLSCERRRVTHSPNSMSAFGNVKCHLLLKLSYISLHGLSKTNESKWE